MGTYSGAFYGIHGDIYRVVIEGEGVGEGGELAFSLSSAPVEIEWKETQKHEPVCGSSLTLRVISASDRQFLPLYSSRVGATRVRVYRNDVEYWHGVMDTEQYEEPYTAAGGYEVTLTFSDFGALDRLNWDEANGYMTVGEIVTACLDRLGLRYGEASAGYRDVLECISTQSGGVACSLSDWCVDVSNFYDEDGEAMTCAEVLEAVLQPMSLRVIQRSGEIYVYDLNALYSGSDALTEVYWDSTDQTLLIDRVYNKVTVTLSPYADATLLDSAISDDILPGDETQPSYLYMTGNDKRGVDDPKKTWLEGFRLRIDTTPGLKDAEVAKMRTRILDSNVYWMRIRGIYSGSDAVGILVAAKSDNDATASNYGKVIREGMEFRHWSAGVSRSLFEVDGGAVYNVGASALRLCVKMDVLFDVRYNPFEGAALENEEGNWGRFEKWLNFAYIPVKLEIVGDDGTVVAHYREKVVAGDYKLDYSASGWYAGAASWGDFRLSYYDWTDRKSKTGMGGWATNRQSISNYKGDLPANYEKRGDGCYIQWPQYEGRLRLTVGGGVFANTDTEPEWGYEVNGNRGCIARWLAYKDVSITAVTANGKEVGDDYTGDIETAAWLDRDAADDLSISLTVGDTGAGLSTARGALRVSSTRRPIAGATYTRAGHTDTLPRLLCGTIFSQYATPSVVLTGEARLIPEFTLLSDAAAEGKKFLIMSEVQDLHADTSVVRMSELQAEDYSSIDYDE